MKLVAIVWKRRFHSGCLCHLRFAKTAVGPDKSESSRTSVQHDRSAISHGQRLMSVPSTRQAVNPAFPSPTDNPIKGFSEMGLSAEMTAGLASLSASQPTTIQMRVIPAILRGENVLAASQTGSGKTLSFVAPIMQMLKQSEADGYVRRHNHPRACIVLPSRELATQTLKVIKQLSYFMPLRSTGLIGGLQKTVVRRSFKEPSDIIVATTGTLLKYKKQGWVSFADLKFLVLDEMDTLLDKSFKESSLQLVNSLRLGDVNRSDWHEEPQCVLAGATVPPQGALDVVKELVPRLKVFTSSLHKILPHVNHRFEKTTTPEKEALLRQLLRSKLGPSTSRQCMIFTNSPGACVWLSKALAQQGTDTLCLHGDMDVKERSNVFERFTKGDAVAMVTTDVASRGLDMPMVGLVVNYDCPTNETDYLHRAGRTGRAAASHSGVPMVSTFVTKNREVALAKRIQTAALKNRRLTDISLKGGIEKMPKQQRVPRAI